jgi:hypothetical protein
MAAEPEISDDGLKFIRDEILKVMVAKIAASREEIAGDVVAANAQTQSAGALQFAVSNLTAVQIGCAVVCALYEPKGPGPRRPGENKPRSEAERGPGMISYLDCEIVSGVTTFFG